MQFVVQLAQEMMLGAPFETVHPAAHLIELALELESRGYGWIDTGGGGSL